MAPGKISYKSQQSLGHDSKQ